MKRPESEGDHLSSVANASALNIHIAVLPVMSPCRMCTTPGVYSGDTHFESGPGEQLLGIVPKLGHDRHLQHL